LLDQISPRAREHAFVLLGVLCIQQLGHAQINDRITQELKPLIVRHAEAAMRERLLQQRDVVKAMAQLGLKALQLSAHGRECLV
jgi:hypothetical protein